MKKNPKAERRESVEMSRDEILDSDFDIVEEDGRAIVQYRGKKLFGTTEKVNISSPPPFRLAREALKIIRQLRVIKKGEVVDSTRVKGDTESYLELFLTHQLDKMVNLFFGLA